MLSYQDEIRNTRKKYGHQAGVENLSDIMLTPYFDNPTMPKERQTETRKKKYQKPATTSSGNKPLILCLKSYDHTPFFNVLKALKNWFNDGEPGSINCKKKKKKKKNTNVVEHLSVLG